MGEFGSFKDPSKRTIASYGINADLNNNLYMLDFNSGDLGILDGKTSKLRVYRADAEFAAAPRPIRRANRLWFAEYDGNAIGMLDPKTEKIQEWVLPTPWGQPYDVVTDKNGEAWTGR